LVHNNRKFITISEKIKVVLRIATIPLMDLLGIVIVLLILDARKSGGSSAFNGESKREDIVAVAIHDGKDEIHYES